MTMSASAATKMETMATTPPMIAGVLSVSEHVGHVQSIFSATQYSSVVGTNSCRITCAHEGVLK